MTVEERENVTKGIDPEQKEGLSWHPLFDTAQLILLGIFMIVWLIDSFILKFSIFLGDYVPLFVRMIITPIFIGFAFYLAKSGFKLVFSEEGISSELVTSDIFSYIRHPMYLAALLFYLGIFLSTLSLASFGIFLGIFIFYNYLASYEEKILEIEFGQEYSKYKKNVSKWIPRLF